MKSILGFFLTVCLLSMTYNCKTSQAGQHTYGYQDSLIQVTEATLFKVVLPSNIGTGYSWSLSTPLDSTMLELVDQEYIENDLMTSEEESREIWRFRAKDQGTTQIKLIYKRPWEEISEESKEQVFQVKIE